MTINDIPAINAMLNGLSATLLVTGYILIKQGNRRAHMKCMIAALCSSSLFLIGYVTHKILVHGVHTPFAGPASLKPVYYVMLLSHTILAVAIVPLIFVTLVRALRERFDAHRKIARLTLPLWLYVSVTGVIIYFVLYQVWPARH